MNLRVDLIYENERRSASPITVRSLVRIAVVTVPTALLVAGAVFFVKVNTLRREAKAVQATWVALEPKYKKAQELRALLVRDQAILAEIEGWTLSRAPWGEHLLALQRMIPEQIQLTGLNVDQGIRLEEEKPVRAYRLHLKGKMRGADAAQILSRFQRDLMTRPPFRGVVEEAVVPRGTFRQDPGVMEDKTARVFELLVTYRSRPFDEVADE